MSTNITVNPWQKFRRLLPDTGRTYGLVASTNSGANTSRVTLQNGDIITVKGSNHSTGARVLIVDGEIRQAVPALSFVTIELY